jgi:hypothetical protein
MRSLNGIIADMECDYGLSPLWDLFEWLDTKARRSGLGSLSRPGQAVLLTQLYDGGMSRGGFDTLLRWEPNLGIMPMIAALEEIGAHRTASVLADLALLFPSGTIPDDAARRSREFNDVVSPREAEMERLGQSLRSAEREENVCQLCLEFARMWLAELRAEDAAPGTSLPTETNES